MDWVTRIQKSLLYLLIAAQLDMLIGSFIDVPWGTCYVSKIVEGKYYNIDQAQRKAFGYTGWSLQTAKDNFDPQYRPSAISGNNIFLTASLVGQS